MLSVFLTAIKGFQAKGGFVMSSHVAMSMMMALFPFLLFVLALAGQVMAEVDAGALIDMTIGSWPKEVSEPIAREVQAVLDTSSARLMSFGALVAAYFASNGVDAVREAMTRAYQGTDTRSFLHQRILCLVFVVCGAAMILGAVIVGIWIPFYLEFLGEKAPDLFHAVGKADVFSFGIGTAMLVFSVAACHLWLPVSRRPVHHIWPGVVVTIGLWAAAGQAFAIYIGRFATYSATYAGLAGAMAALIFLYLMAAILIFGAEVNAALDQKREDEASA